MARDGDERGREHADAGTHAEDTGGPEAEPGRDGYGSLTEPAGFSGIRTGREDETEPGPALAYLEDAPRPVRAAGGCLAGCAYTALALLFVAGAGIGLLLLALHGAGSHADESEQRAWERAREEMTAFAGDYRELLAGQDGPPPADGWAVRELAHERDGRLMALRWQEGEVTALVHFEAAYSDVNFFKGHGFVRVCGVVTGVPGVPAADQPQEWEDCSGTGPGPYGTRDALRCPSDPEPGSGCWSKEADQWALAGYRADELHAELAGAALPAGTGPAPMAAVAAGHDALLFGYRSGAGTTEALLMVGLLPGEPPPRLPPDPQAGPDRAEARHAAETEDLVRCVRLRWTGPERGPEEGLDAAEPCDTRVYSLSAYSRDWCGTAATGQRDACWLLEEKTGEWSRWQPGADPAAGDPGSGTAREEHREEHRAEEHG
ncbi:hypothetical protein [Streptomyces sp. YIM 98790]|uniref:hypothetical protein n=1 Tax=Streptomyces sp. YIM 98790 TaxID=2689077 RepID=UPI00140C8360|nr:hypothetical protein [Streptomyces sp. YIM 98790]